MEIKISGSAKEIAEFLRKIETQPCIQTNITPAVKDQTSVDTLARRLSERLQSHLQK